MTYEHGRILAVNEVTLGSELVGDTLAGVLSLTVEDPVDFDEDGGSLVVNGQVIEYTTYDDDTGEITLAEALAADAEEGDHVSPYDPYYAVASTEKIAQVELDGDDYNTDPIEANLAHHLVKELGEGIRGIRGESCLLELDGDEWRIVDVLGLAGGGGGSATGQQYEADDFYVLTADDITTGTATVPLSHQPINESLVAVLGGVPQEPTEYTINYDAKTITWPLDGFEQAGNRIWVHYAYLVTGASPYIPLSIPIGHTWKYATGLGSSATYAAVGFDDSAWASGPSGFGWGTGYATWIGTAVPAPMDVWTRIDVDTSGGDLTFIAPIGVDNAAQVYLDEALIWDASYASAREGASITVPCPAGSHVIAIHGTDDGSSGGYCGFTIEEAP